MKQKFLCGLQSSFRFGSIWLFVWLGIYSDYINTLISSLEVIESCSHWVFFHCFNNSNNINNNSNNSNNNNNSNNSNNNNSNNNNSNSNNNNSNNNNSNNNNSNNNNSNNNSNSNNNNSNNNNSNNNNNINNSYYSHFEIKELKKVQGRLKDEEARLCTK